MSFAEFIKAIIFGIVEGITEWLPISSTGHMILLDRFMPLKVNDDFKEMFLVVIQLGAIMAVVILYWHKIFPFSFKKDTDFIKKDIMDMWFKIIAACVPAAIVGIILDDWLDDHLYNYVTVSIMLILFGVFFILIENRNSDKKARITTLPQITYKHAVMIGIFQLIAAVFPGTSRSGATILGGLMIGLSRTVAAEFTFFLAIPVMLGASLLKLVKFGGDFTATEAGVLITGMITAFVVSVFAIKFLMGYIKKHNFKPFGWYRIILGSFILLYFWIN